MTKIAVTQAHLDYLEGMRDAGDMNILGATPYLGAEFGVDRHQAKDIILYFMKHGTNLENNNETDN